MDGRQGPIRDRSVAVRRGRVRRRRRRRRIAALISNRFVASRSRNERSFYLLFEARTNERVCLLMGTQRTSKQARSTSERNDLCKEKVSASEEE